MDSGMIGKVEKAKRYAEDRHRFHFNQFDLNFHGDNSEHHVSYDNGVFTLRLRVFYYPPNDAATPWRLRSCSKI